MTDSEQGEPTVAESARGRVAAGLARVAELDQRPLAEHAPVYEALHEQLQSELAQIDGA